MLAAAGLKVVSWLAHAWSSNPYFSHGPLVVLCGVGLAIWRYVQHAPSVHDSLATDKSGVSFHTPERWLEHFLFPVGSALLLISLALNLSSPMALGWGLAMIGLIHWRIGAQRFQVIAFPLYFVLLCIPWPWGIVQMIALPMQEFSATLARFILDLSGLPVLQEGVVLDTGHFRLVVEETCSGLRSFIALLTVAVFLIGAGWGTKRQRWILPLVVLLIILCGNAMRLITTIVLGHWINAEWAVVWLDDIAPFLIIFAEIAILMTWLNAPAGKHNSPRLQSSLANILRKLPRFVSWSPTGRFDAGRLAAVIFLLLTTATYVIPAPDSSVSLPEWPIPAGWQPVKGKFLDKSLDQILTAMQEGAVARVIRVRSLTDRDSIVDGQIIVSKGGPGRDVDDPRFCYRSLGWRMLMEEIHPLSSAGSGAPSVSEILEENPVYGVVRLDWFAYRVGNAWINSYSELRFHQLLARAMRRLDSIAIVHVSTPVMPGGNRGIELARARKRLNALWQTMPLQ